MRRPTAGYYPHSRTRLRRQLDRLFDNAPDRELQPRLTIAPHGSLQDAGQVAANVYGSIDFSAYRNIVILGAKHRDIGPQRAASIDSWKTPFGQLQVDRTFVDQLTTKGIFQRSEQAHSHETSIEMQLPYLQHQWDDFDIVPLLIDNDLDQDEHKETVSAIRAALNPSDLLIVGTDLVHYGPGQYHPETDDPGTLVRQRDSELINSLKAWEREEVSEQSERFHVCGREPLLTGMDIVGRQDLCHVLGHTTSFKSGSDKRTVTGFGGLCYT